MKTTLNNQLNMDYTNNNLDSRVSQKRIPEKHSTSESQHSSRESNTKIFIDRVMRICLEQDVNEIDCVPLITQWCSSLPQQVRPNQNEILMSVKRSLYGLSPLPQRF